MDSFVIIVLLVALSLVLINLLWRAKRDARATRMAHGVIALQYADLKEESRKLEETLDVYRRELDTERLNHVVTVDQVTESGYQSNRDLLVQLDLLQTELTEAQKTIREQREENRALFELSVTDPLTGLANRHGLETRFEEECARLKRIRTNDPNQAQQVVVLTMDLDHFKALNDNAGHDAGDRALREVARLLRQFIGKRPSDTLSRFGGDEFVAVLPGATIDHVRQSAMEFLHAMDQQLAFRWLENEAGVTSSFGVTIGTFDPRNSTVDWLKAMIKESDQALYEAKRAGRRTVCVYGQSPSLDIQLPDL